MTCDEKKLQKPLDGRFILVTSGPTRAYIDKIRFITNTSTGKLGTNISLELYRKGANVLFMYGSGSEETGCTYSFPIEVDEVQGIETAIRDITKEYRIEGVVHAMAVLDYAPSNKFDGKIPSSEAPFDVTFVPVPKVIHTIRTILPEAVLVSFKLETGVDDETLIKRAHDSLIKYNSDYVVANDSDRITWLQHPALIINVAGEIVARCETKQEIAETIASLFVKEFELRSAGMDHSSFVK